MMLSQSLGFQPKQSKPSIVKAGSAILRSNERVFLCGKTGSGKTYLAKYLTSKLHRLVVLDGKGSESIDSWSLDPWDREARRLLKIGEPVLARVRWDIGQEPEDFWTGVLTECYNALDLTIYIDEIYMIVPPATKPMNIFSACYTMGRERGIGVWASTQRPANVPMICKSEAEHYFMFRLQLQDDRDRMAEFMSPIVAERVIPDEHGFYYMRAEWDTPKYIPQFKS